jgi:hypothetical protein
LSLLTLFGSLLQEKDSRLNPTSNILPETNEFCSVRLIDSLITWVDCTTLPILVAFN